MDTPRFVCMPAGVCGWKRGNFISQETAFPVKKNILRGVAMFEEITISGFADELGESLEQQIQGFQRLGITHMEIRGVNGKNLVEYSSEEVKKFKEELDLGGIRVSSIGSPIGKIRITDPFEPHFELFRHTVEIAGIMETRYIRMFSFYMPEGEDPAGYREEVMRRLAYMAEYAAEKGVVLLHENEKGIYGDTAPRCLEIMERFYGESFRAVFDFANFVQCGQDTWEAYEMLKPYIAYVHIKDALAKDRTVTPAGYGDGNVEKILGMLKNCGYRGFLSLEPHLDEFSRFGQLAHSSFRENEHPDGEERFAVAQEALQQILERL